MDDAAGVRMVVEHLRCLGHERIGHVAAPQSMSTGYARYDAYVSAMGEIAYLHDDRYVAFAESLSIAAGERCAESVLAVSDRPTAIIAGNDMLALGCYSGLEHAGLRCPEDVSIVGFNDMPFVDRMSPPLTTVRIPHHEIGVAAAELLLARLRDPDAPVRAVQLPPELVVRSSTAPAREHVGVP